MRKIVNGKKYDTETAEFLGKWCSSSPINDFSYCEESLYRKKTGEYFLYGSGNAGSRYNRSVGLHEYCGGENITPFTEAEAKRWSEKWLEVDEYEKIFDEVEE